MKQDSYVTSSPPAAPTVCARTDSDQPQGRGEEAVIKRIAEVAAAVGWQAGVGAMETAGQIVSCLYANPEHIQRFMEEGTELFIDGTFNPENGALTYLARNGNITSPSVLRKRKGAEQ